MSRERYGPDFVQSLARGLEVLTAFSEHDRPLTLAEVARLAALNRATARRLLYTLDRLGYVHLRGRGYSLTPKVLDLGYAYLSALDLGRFAQGEMEALVERTHESCSAAVLDGAEIVYVARVPTKRIMTISLGLGSRLPAYATSMGRVLLAELEPDDLAAVLTATDLTALTSRTVTQPDALAAELARVRRQGWALVDQELEEGLRSIAAPLREASGRAIAAMNVSAHAGRVTLGRLQRELLPLLLEAAERVSARLAKRQPAV